MQISEKQTQSEPVSHGQVDNQSKVTESMSLVKSKLFYVYLYICLFVHLSVE